MSNNTARTEVAEGQNQKEVTINDSDGRLDAALTEFLDNDYTSGDVTLTTTEFQSNVRFNATNLTVARALNLPEIKKLFVVDNASGTATLTVTQGSTTIALLATDVGLFYTDGTTNGLVQVGGGGGATDFLALTDTPSSFSAQALKTVRVNGGETALEFITSPTVVSTVPPFKGAKATLTGAFATSSSEAAITWASEDFDTDAFHDNVTNNTRITIPAGITKVILTCNIDTGTPASGVIQITIRKNGEAFPGRAGQSEIDAGAGSELLSLSTGPIDVVEGDFFEVFAFSGVAGLVDATTGSHFTVMAVETSVSGTSVIEATSTDAGATAGPDIKTFRDSASPATADFIGRYLFDGRSSTGVRVTYGSIELQIDDATNGSEDASLFLKAMIAGTLTTILELSETASTFSSAISVDDTTESTSVTTGSIHTDGGLGVAKDVFFGATLELIAGRTTARNSTVDPSMYRSNTDSGAKPFNAFGNFILETRASLGISLFIITGINNDVALELDSSQTAIFSGDIDPAITETQDIGSVTLEWDNIFLQNAPTVSDSRRKNDLGSADILVSLMQKLDPRMFSRKSKVVKEAVPEQILQRQKVEIIQEEQEKIIIIDGVPVLTIELIDVEKPIFKLVTVKDENGVSIKKKGLTLKHEVPVMEDYVIPAQDEVVVLHGRPHSGFMAQDVKALMEELGLEDWAGYAYHNEDGEDTHVLRLLEFIAPILAYTQKLEGRIEVLEAVGKVFDQ